MIITKKENYLDILDSKQDFLIAKKDKKKKDFYMNLILKHKQVMSFLLVKLMN